MSSKWVRGLSLLNVIANVIIVVTGGAVRLTGSGLGCPTWPNCAAGTFHATAEMGIHGAIEWGNRLLSVAVGIIAVATLLAAIAYKPRRTSLIWLTGAVTGAVVLQGGIGAFTVNTGLAPWLVSIHFLVSMGILAFAYTAWRRANEPDGTIHTRALPTAVRVLWWLVAGAATASLIVGTLVTGAGPHAGDPNAPRLALDPAVISQVHADVVFALIGLSLGLALCLHALRAHRSVVTAAWVLLAVELGQGAIGMVQYFTGLPELLVGAHLAGACLLWLAVLSVGLRLDTTHTASTEAEPDAEVTGAKEHAVIAP
ncbi:MAG TPA: COX15/CtaA family protein [Candidatus Stackebrandtia faecavium]|nr:COX15/CtaA family protein [Candidatus Stackebrandtia faecavium]